MTDLLLQAFIYLSAAVIAVPLAKYLGLGSVLGYLVAGIVIGPVTGLVGSETQNIQHFAEFGVVMMLFLVGLSLTPKTLWKMRVQLLGFGSLQVFGTTILVMLAALSAGLTWKAAFAIGLVFSLSSTAIVLQTLEEKDLMQSSGGNSSFSVLLFQDIAVIAMLAVVPLLSSPELLSQNASKADSASSASLITHLPNGLKAVVIILTIIATIGIGHLLSRTLFRFVANTKLREVFTAAALMLVIGTAVLMSFVGLSPALGTFLAGVVLANSEFRHELESAIEPFKGLLLGLFFITVGAGINFSLLFADFIEIIGLTLGLMLLKAIILWAIAALFKMHITNKWLFTLSLAQAGEFGFVLLAFCVDNAVLPTTLADKFLLVVAISMLLTPILFIFFDRIVLPLADKLHATPEEKITEIAPIIIAGHGRFGQIINRTLLSSGYHTVVIDHHAELIDGMRKFGAKIYYGDASRPELLAAAGIAKASLLIVAIDNPKQAVTMVKHARKEYPNLHIIARAHNRDQVYQLYYAGAHDIVREVFDSSVRASQYALEALGHTPEQATEHMQKFVAFDKKAVKAMAKVWKSDVSNVKNSEYIALAKTIREQLDEIMQSDQLEADREYSSTGHRRLDL